MSKYGKKLKNKEYLEQLRATNRMIAQKERENGSVCYPNSTRATFDEWCEECGDELYEFYGVLSIGGSDGISMSNTKVGKAKYSDIYAVDKELEDNGYYEDGVANMGSYDFKAPTMKYSEWFLKKYGDK